MQSGRRDAFTGARCHEDMRCRLPSLCEVGRCEQADVPSKASQFEARTMSLLMKSDNRIFILMSII
jgi:hypothetical protein